MKALAGQPDVESLITRRIVGDQPQKFRLVPFGAITLGTAPRYRVKGLLPLTGLAVFWGPPKCGKSFFVFDLLMHVALGWDYRGRRVMAGPVVYAALEGQSGFEARAAAFRQHRLADAVEPVPFFLMPTPLTLVKDGSELIAAIRAQIGKRMPAVVCLDTLNRSFAGSESDDEAMTAYVKAADAIRDAFGCLVVIVHHCGLEGQRPRGHSSLAGALDAQLGVRKTGEGQITVTVDLMKDGPEGETIASRLVAVDVGTDDEGDPITSCVIEANDEGTGKAGRALQSSGPRLNDKQELALAALGEAIITAGNSAPQSFGLPISIRTTGLMSWRDEMVRRGILDPEAANPREDFRRIKLGLMRKSVIAERDGLVWAVPA